MRGSSRFALAVVALGWWSCALAQPVPLRPGEPLPITPEAGAPAPSQGSAQAPAAAPEPEPDLAETPPVQALRPARTPEFLRRSGSRAGGPANELNTGDSRATEQPSQGSVADMLSGRDLYHGNYCGPGNRGSDKAPVDALDATCQRHDACYEAAGYRSCACDDILREEALAAAALPNLSRVVRARAASVVESIPLMGCRRP